MKMNGTPQRNNMPKEIGEYRKKHRRKKIWLSVTTCLACVAVFCVTYALILPAVTLTEGSDPTADVETTRDWEKTFEDVELTGNYAADLLAIAQTQLGYQESTKNFVWRAGADSEGNAGDETLGENPDDGIMLIDETQVTGQSVEAETMLIDETQTTEQVTEVETEQSVETEVESGDPVAMVPTGGEEPENPVEVTPRGTEEADVEKPAEQTTEVESEAGTEQTTEGDEDNEPTTDDNVESETGEPSDEPEVSESYAALYDALNELYAAVKGYTGDANDLVSLYEAAYNTAADLTEQTASLYKDGDLTEDEYTTLVSLADEIKTHIETTVGNLNLVKKGYTRYGAWYGDAYGDWCAVFVSFCLNYAEVPTSAFPQDANCISWISTLDTLGLYHSASGDYIAQPGDLVFFDLDNDGSADQVGIVAGLTNKTNLSESEREAVLDGSINSLIAMEEMKSGTALITIEGDSFDKVQTCVYSLTDETILGYGSVPGYTYEGLENALARLKGSSTIAADTLESMELAADALFSEGKITEKEWEDLKSAMDEIRTMSTALASEDKSPLAIVCYTQSLSGAAMLNTTNSSDNMTANEISYTATATNTDGVYSYTIYDTDPDSLALWYVYSDEDCTQPVTHITSSQTVWIKTTVSGSEKYLAVNSTATGSSATKGGVYLTDTATSVYLKIEGPNITANEGNAIKEGYTDWFSIYANKENADSSADTSSHPQRAFLAGSEISNGFSSAYYPYQLCNSAFQLMQVEELKVDPEDYKTNLGTYFIGSTHSQNGTVMLNERNSGGRLSCTAATIEKTNDGSCVIYVSPSNLDEKKAAFELWTIYGCGGSGDDGSGEASGITESGVYFVTTEVDGTTYYLSVTGNSASSVELTTDPAPVYITVDTNTYAGELMFSDVVWENGAWAVGSSCMKIDTTSGAKGVGGDGSGEANRWFVVGTVEELVYETVQGTDPPGTIINLFDYWTSERWPDNGDYNESGQEDAGINSGRSLVFSVPNTLSNTKGWSWNKATGDSNYINLMEKTLGDDNYPKLNSTTVSNASGSNSADVEDSYSMAYLFDPGKTLTNSDGNSDYKMSWQNVTGLLQVDSDGYYYYDCTKNFAQFDEDTKSFTLYADPGVISNSGSATGQFFPFNDIYEVKDLESTNPAINHYFGMSLIDRFLMTNNGYTDSEHKSPMIFEFSGDDDVWIFIDGVLVADLGGIHNTTGVSIDFSTGTITYSYNGRSIQNNGTQNTSTTIKAMFEAAGKDSEHQWTDNTFSDGSYHTLQFYYLERGNYDSNMSLKYNLTSINETSIYKVDQYGDTIAGAGFAAYKAGEGYKYLADDGENYIELSECSSYSVSETNGVITAVKDEITYTITPKFSGFTDSSGELVFTNEYGGVMSSTELQNLLGDNFILREFYVPPGYKNVADEIYLYFDNGSYLLCDNVFESGAKSTIGALVTASSELYYVENFDGGTKTYSGDPITYYDTSRGTHTGTLFAVVLKKNGAGDEVTVDYWYPVSGNSEDGYVVSSTSAAEDIGALIEIAKSYGTTRVFSVGDSGKMQLDIEDLPGSITEYYTYQQMKMGDKYSLENCRAASEYFIAYYYSTAETLDEATANNTKRVISRNQVIDGYSGFGYDIASVISVTNLENRLYIYKMAEGGSDFIEGAVFAMYAVDEDEGGSLYYIADDGTHIYLDEDTDGDNSGTAHIGSADGTSGTYKITAGDYQRDTHTGYVTTEGYGVITVTKNETTYTITPIKNPDGTSEVVYTHEGCDFNYMSDPGYVAHFTKIPNGKYVVREIYAPEHFLLNTTEVRVLFTNNATYADAGTADDGISVGKDSGYLVHSLYTFASEGEIDNTLTWIYSLLEKGSSEEGFSTLLENDVAHTVGEGTFWQYGISIDGTDAMTKNDVTTSDKSKSIVTYLEFDHSGNDAIFNYKVNNGTNDDSSSGQAERKNDDDTASTGKGIGTRRLWTDTGWSYMAIYQDYIYGSAHKQANASYEKLDGSVESSGSFKTTTYGADGEISNLFSRSTYVVFYDKITVDLEIEKIDAASSNDDNLNNLAGAEFVLYKTTGDDQTSVTTYYKYTAESEDGEDTVSWVTEKSNATTLSTGEDGYQGIHVYGLTPGTYYLEEVKSPEGYNLLTGPVTITVAADGNVSITYGNTTYSTETHTGDTSGWSVSKKTTENETATDEYTWIVTVPNQGGYELPETGGSGTNTLYLIGLALMLGCGIGLAAKKW